MHWSPLFFIYFIFYMAPSINIRTTLFFFLVAQVDNLRSAVCIWSVFQWLNNTIARIFFWNSHWYRQWKIFRFFDSSCTGKLTIFIEVGFKVIVVLCVIAMYTSCTLFHLTLETFLNRLLKEFLTAVLIFSPSWLLANDPETVKIASAAINSIFFINNVFASLPSEAVFIWLINLHFQIWMVVPVCRTLLFCRYVF